MTFKVSTNHWQRCRHTLYWNCRNSAIRSCRIRNSFYFYGISLRKQTKRTKKPHTSGMNSLWRKNILLYNFKTKANVSFMPCWSDPYCLFSPQSCHSEGNLKYFCFKKFFLMWKFHPNAEPAATHLLLKLWALEVCVIAAVNAMKSSSHFPILRLSFAQISKSAT